MNIVTASRLPLLQRCQLFPRLDWVESDTPEALLGSAFHAFAAYAVNMDGGLDGGELDFKGAAKTYGVSDLVLQAMWENAAPIIRELIPAGAKPQVEFAFVYDYEKDTAVALKLTDPRKYDSAVRLGVNMESANGIAETEIPGTIDLVADCGDYVLVADYKTGRAEDVDGVETNLQLDIAGLALARILNKERARKAIVYVGEDATRIETAEMTALDFDGINPELKRLVGTVRYAGAQPNPLCKWCPGKLGCPATGKALMKVVPSLPAEMKLTGPIASPAEATARVMILPLVKSFVGAWETDIKAYADKHGGIRTPDGLYKNTKRDNIDIEALGAVELIKKFRAGKAIETKRTISKTSIKRAVKNNKNPKERFEEIIAELREIGAITESSGGHRIVKDK